MVSAINGNPQIPNSPPPPNVPNKNPNRPPLMPSSSTKGNAPRHPAKNITPSFSSNRPRSVDRTRASASHNAATPEPPSAAARALCITTRTLSVSFQEEPFFFRTSKIKPPTTPVPTRKPAATPARNTSHRPWPGNQKPNLMARRLDFSSTQMKEPVLVAVRLLQQSLGFNDGSTRASFDVSNTESASPGSNLWACEHGVPARPRVMPRGIVVPARFLQEPRTPISTPKMVTPKKTLQNGQLASPWLASSSMNRPLRPSSPSKLPVLSSRGMASPSQGRSSVLSSSSPINQLGNAPSIASFAAEVRRAKKGESCIEEAHLLRLVYNQYLQWRFVNAQASDTMMAQRLTIEKDLYSAWIRISELSDSVTAKRIKLLFLRQKLKLTLILDQQMAYLEDWSLIEKEHLNSLTGAIEALKASTLRLPVIGGAKADLQEVKDTVCSAIALMQAMTTSISSPMAQVERTSSLMSELAEIAAQERALLEQSRNLLSMVAIAHVKHCSLHGHILQLNQKLSLKQVLRR